MLGFTGILQLPKIGSMEVQVLGVWGGLNPKPRELGRVGCLS